MEVIQTRIKQKRDSSSNWDTANPVILNGEIILVDTKAGELRAKIGDGVKHYKELPFSDEALRTLIKDSEDKVAQQITAHTENKENPHNVTAEQIKFADGQNFQQKYDAGQLTGPAGLNGQNGAAGAPGKDGSAATIRVGTVSTSEAGTQASVTNAGTENAAILNFTIPCGASGKDGATGPAGTSGRDGAPGKNATINGVNALTVAAKNGISGSMSGSTYTIDGSGLMPKAYKVTLTVAGWDAPVKTQKVTVSGVLADETKQLIMPMPAMASQNAYAAAGIACTLQEANALTFKCQTVPTENITVFVTVQGVSG